ncbi:MAG: LysR family transcriptional regulator [Roseibium sp.]|uniref:LysR family transcriptional regulator n=1 Tax=Roseibium sp. TaxID=1936156 RepID=UPI00262E2748|nr:LysR family transcriptional regulator [Roseibium sp.]MCV0426637.1 LysR family transcriptional regulator [Roseibium sp.]
MHKLRWDDLQFVYAVAEQGSLSAASRALGVNHATVLRRIAWLEETNDVKLFDRSKNGYSLRPEGRALLASLKLMDHASARIGRSLALTAKGIEGTFRLATTDAIACLLLPGLLSTLRETHPNINIEIAVSNDPIDMSLSGAEILIRPGADLPPELSGVRAWEVDFGVYGSPLYLEQNAGLPIDGHKWLGVAPGFAKSTVGEWQFSAIRSRFEFTADSFLTLAGLAAQGLGLAMLPGFVGRNTHNLVPADEFPGGPTTGVWVATHSEFRRQNDIETLLSFFAAALARDAGQVKQVR